MPEVTAVAAYGSTADRSWNEFSDVDVVAVLSIEPPVESLRFFVDDVAVDLNFRSDSDDSVHGVRGSDFMPEVVAVWDPGNVFERMRARAARLRSGRHTDHAVPVLARLGEAATDRRRVGTPGRMRTAG